MKAYLYMCMNYSICCTWIWHTSDMKSKKCKLQQCISTCSSCSAKATATGISNHTRFTQFGDFTGLTHWCIIAIPHSFKPGILIIARLPLARWGNKNPFKSDWIHKIRAAVIQHEMRRWTFNSLLFHYLFVTLFILLLRFSLSFC